MHIAIYALIFSEAVTGSRTNCKKDFQFCFFCVIVTIEICCPAVKYAKEGGNYMRLLTCDEMKRVEKHAAGYGMSYQRMMENAGAACARNIRNVIEKEKQTRRNIAVVCGKGNNGGDGFVIARKLFENGYHVCLILATGYPTTNEAERCYKEATEQSIPTVWYNADRMKAFQTIKTADVIVDAIFGFSFRGAIQEELKNLMKEMNAAGALKFSVDVPSGVFCDSGLCDKHSFCADYTIAVSALKPVHVIHPASDCCGNVIIANIGIPEESFAAVDNQMYTYNTAEIAQLFPARSVHANKGTFGHLLSICGSRKMPGAACLAAKAALRSGTGLVTAAFPASMYTTMSLKLTEALLLPLQETPQGTLSSACVPTLLKNLPKYDAILIGCGLSVNEDTTAVLRAVLENADVPVIIDADGINILAKHPELLQNAAAPIVLTPHPKEMSSISTAPATTAFPKAAAVMCSPAFSAPLPRSTSRYRKRSAPLFMCTVTRPTG